MKNKGFTLIEVSIVLAVIALIIGGVLMGQSFIRSAELREVIGDYDRYTKAIKEFEDKYKALPGDMNNAETIWGSDTACPNTITNTTLKVLTCNGDGNGRIGGSSTAGILDITIAYEWFRAWQQLSNAGLIKNKFTGVKESATDGDAGIGLNIPQSQLTEKSGWTLYYYLNTTTTTTMWGDNYGHVLSLGGDTTSISNSIALSPTDARSIDKKIDDGAPGTGTIRSQRTAADANCTTNDTSQSLATYNTSYKNEACSLLFILGF